MPPLVSNVFQFLQAVQSRLRSRVGLIALALRRNFSNVQLNALGQPSVLVVAPGGVASTTLIAYIAKYRSTNDMDDRDGLKHLPRPPRVLGFTDQWKCIFVRGDPQDVYASIARRGWVAIQGAKLGSVACVILTGAWQKRAFVNAVIRQDRTWAALPCSNILRITYDEIWTKSDDIARFLDIPATEFVDQFPLRKQRTSLASGNFN